MIASLPSSPAASAVTDRAAPVAAPTVTLDPYHGLLTKPPGKWGIISHGSEKAIILCGSDDFIRLNTNLLSSFGGGRRSKADKNAEIKGKAIYDNLTMVAITEERLLGGLQSYLYGCIYKAKAQVVEILDDEGDCVGLDIPNADAMMEEAIQLARQFYDSLDHGYCGESVYQGKSTPVAEHVVSDWSGADHDDWS